jgi:aldehyde:ferredoxin oxidoreductase
MGTAKAQWAMLGRLSSKKAATVAIGPAGEQLIKYAAVFTQPPLYRCFGRGGAGCVMGSKKLKGMVVIGDGEVEIPDKDRFEALKRGIVTKLQTDGSRWADQWRRYGTAADLQIMNQAGIIPTRNWQTGQFGGWQRIDKSTTPMGWPENSRPCGPYCLTPCTRYVEVKEGPYKGANTDGPEWETMYAFGSECGVDKIEAVIAASEICDEFGIDTMTAGITIGFAMECFEKGLIGLKDTDNIELRFGNDEAMIAMLRKIVNQDGFGKQLAKGTRRLSKEINGSEAFAMQVKGMELGGYECRGLNGQALQFAINNRGGCHHGYGLPARVEINDGTRLNTKGKGEQVKTLTMPRIIGDSLVICVFPLPIVFSMDILAHTISALFGESWSVDDLNKVGERIMCQERLFNMREGITRTDDSLPARLLNELKPDGPTRGVMVPLEELKSNFYAAMGYDLLSGNPPDSLLVELGIEKGYP